MRPEAYNTPARELRSGKRSLPGGFWAALAFLGLSFYLFLPLLGCLDRCYVDLEAVHGPKLGGFELNDTRLNTWILAWVQHALLTQPLDLYQANAFYPAPDALTGSEHLIGLALLTLPLRLFTSNAILVYQLTLVLSSWLLAITTFALVRWLTSSVWVALVAGAIALFMPWRTAELSHLQLLGAHWFPLIWLLALRILLGEERRWDTWWLSLVLALQLLTSYYLAYQLSATLALFALVAVLREGLARGSLLRLGGAAAIPYVLLALISLPYRSRESRGELFASLDPEIPIGLETIADAWFRLAPRFDTFWHKNPGVEPSYFVPAAVAILSCVALGFALARRPAHQGARRMEIAVLSLWVCMLGAFVMSIGAQITAGEFVLKLPGYWAAKLVPGYANLRAPHRWGITIGIATPVLAGVAIRYVEAALPALGWSRRGFPARRLVQVALSGLLLINLPWLQRIPAKEAWEHPERIDTTYRALEALPRGPVLEIPWPPNPLTSIDHDTRYMVASTRHWRPILNGFTAYLPPTAHVLRRVAQGLPEPDAVEKLRLLTDLRWIVVHTDELRGAQQRRWLELPGRGDLARVYADDHTLIFEMPQQVETGVWMRALSAVERRSETLSGLPREPLDLPPNAGRIEVLSVAPLRYLETIPWHSPVRLAVTNASRVGWPGLDPQREGLVELRYVFSHHDDRVVEIGLAPLDADVPAGSRVAATPLIDPPTRGGSYRLCLDLVQFFGEELRPLPLTPVELEVEVTGIEAKPEAASRSLAFAYRHRRPAPAGAVSRCAALRPASD